MRLWEKLKCGSSSSSTNEGLNGDHCEEGIPLTSILPAEDTGIWKSVVWRKENSVDDILKEGHIESLRSTFPMKFGSRDNAGRPVVFVQFNKWELSRISTLSRLGVFQRFVISIFERLQLQVERPGTEEVNDNKFCVIIDARGFSFYKLLSLTVVRQLMHFPRTLDAHYPGALHKCLIITRDPSVSTRFLRILLRLSSVRRRRCHAPSLIQFCYENSDWMNLLRSCIPSEELLMEYGGWKQL